MQVHRVFVVVATVMGTAPRAFGAGGDWCTDLGAAAVWTPATSTCELIAPLPAGTQIVVDDPGATVLGGSLTGQGVAAVETAITVVADGVTIHGTEISSYHTAIALESDGNTVEETHLSEYLMGISLGDLSPRNDNLISKNSLITSLRFVPGRPDLGPSFGMTVIGSHNRIWGNSTDGAHLIDIFLPSVAGIDGQNEVFGNDVAHGGNVIALLVHSPSNVIWDNRIRLTEQGRGTAIGLANSPLARLGLAPRGDDNRVLYNEIDGSISGQPCLMAGDPCAPGSDGIVSRDVNSILIQGNRLLGTLRNFRGITVAAAFNDVTSVEILDNSMSDTAGEAITLTCLRGNGNVSMSGVRVQGNSVINTFSGVRITDNGENCAIHDNWILGNEARGSFESGIGILSFAGSVTGNWFGGNELNISNEAFDRLGSGIRLFSFGGGITSNYFVANETNGNLGDGIELDGAGVQSNVFEGGEANNNGGVGIHLIDANGNTLTGVEAKGNILGAALEEGAAIGNNTIVLAD